MTTMIWAAAGIYFVHVEPREKNEYKKNIEYFTFGYINLKIKSLGASNDIS